MSLKHIRKQNIESKFMKYAKFIYLLMAMKKYNNKQLINTHAIDRAIV